MYTYLVQGYPSSGERFIFRRWEGYDTASHEKIIITQPGSTSTRIAIIDMLDDIMLVFNHATQQLMCVRSPNKIIWMIADFPRLTAWRLLPVPAREWRFPRAA